MKELSEVVSVTYGEFQAWYNYGEIRLAAQRLALLDDSEFSEESRSATSPIVSALLGRIPQLSLDDEEGVLLVRLRARNTELAPLGNGQLDAQTVLVQIGDVEEVIPLTDRARRILEPRLHAFGLRLSPAYFEADAQEALGLRGVRRARRGGDALVELLFDVKLDCIHDTYGRSARFAIRLLDNRSQVDRAQTHDPDDLEKWVSFAFGYTRHDPYDLGNLGYLMDAGIILKDLWERDSQGAPDLERYREIIKQMKRRRQPADGLNVILDEDLIADYSENLSAQGARAFPDGLAPLVMFLRWKDVFHKNGNSVDFDILFTETQTLVDSIGSRPTAVAVWLLGCFVGYECIAPEIYRAGGEKVYPWYSGPVRRIQKLREPTALTDGAKGTVRRHQASESSMSAGDGEPGAHPHESEDVESGTDLATVAQGSDQVTNVETPRVESEPNESLGSGSGESAQEMGTTEDAGSTSPTTPDQGTARVEELKGLHKTDLADNFEELDDRAHGREPENDDRKRKGKAQGKHGRTRKGSDDQPSPSSKKTKADADKDKVQVGDRDLFDGASIKASSEPERQ